MLECFSHGEQNPTKIRSLIFDHMQRFTFVGSLKFGKSRENIADKPNAKLMTNPSKRNVHEYLTTNVEYLRKINESFLMNRRSFSSIDKLWTFMSSHSFYYKVHFKYVKNVFSQVNNTTLMNDVLF